MKNDLRQTKLTNSVVNLHIASWDGSSSGSNLSITEQTTKVKALRAAVIAQLGDVQAEFDASFINYKTGHILCTNTPALLIKFFINSSDEAIQAQNVKLRSAIRFTLVRMPSEFLNRNSGLSSQYEIGEKLSVRAALEVPFYSRGNQQEMLYKDLNIKGRSVTGGAKSGGGGVGVWS